MTSYVIPRYGAEPRAQKRRIQRIVDGVKRAASRVGLEVEKLAFHIRDALIFARRPDPHRPLEKRDPLPPDLLAYARSLLSRFVWTPDKPYFFASYETIAAEIGMSVRGAIDLMRRLIEAKIVVRFRRLARETDEAIALLQSPAKDLGPEDRAERRRLLREGLHEAGEIRTNVWIFVAPPHALRDLSQRQRYGREVVAGLEDRPKRARAGEAAASSPAQRTEPAAPLVPRRVWAPHEIKEARQAILALPKPPAALDLQELLNTAAAAHPGRALEAIRVGIAELAKGLKGRATVKQVLSFVEHTRLTEASPRPSLAEELRRDREDAERDAAKLEGALPLLPNVRGLVAALVGSGGVPPRAPPNRAPP